nr:hypothetical protein [Tanacetum cinerariifolium]
MFTTIKLVSRHQNTQQFGALLPIELTNEDIRNSNAYKEYYAVATGATPPKPKASVWKTRSSARVTTSIKGKQVAKASKGKSLSALSKVAMTEAQQLKLVTKRSLQQTHISQASGSGADEGIGSIPGVPDVPTDETMATTIEQQVVLDEALVPSTQRLRIGRSNFKLPSDIQSKESTLQVVYDVLCRCPFFKAFLVTADEDFMYQVEHKNHKKSNEMYYPRFTKVIIHHFMSKDLSIPKRNKVRDDMIFSTIKVVSRHQNTQQYGVMLPIKLTNDEIRNTKAYKDYYACATGEAAPKPKASARKKRSGSDTCITPPTAITTLTTTIVVALRLAATTKGKQPAKAKSPSDPSEVARTKAQQLKIVLRRSRQQMHISLLGGSGTDEGTGSKPGVQDIPSNDSEEEISWNSSDDEDANAEEKDRDDDEGDEKDESDDGEEDGDNDKDGDERDDDDDDEEEIAKIDEQESAKIDEHDDTKRGGDDDKESKSDEEDDDEETRDEESFDPIPRTPKGSEDDGNDDEDQGLKTGEEERLNEEEEADELYRDVDINRGRGIQVSQEIQDSHVTLNLVNPDGQQESSSVLSQFVTNLLNPTSDAGVESVFATASTSIAPLPKPTPTMTPSIIATITSASQAPIPPTTFPSDIL